MKNKTMIFTKTDYQILDTYKVMAEGLANFLGDGYEIVLHSMESLEDSVIKIVNGNHSGRTIGSPITDLGLTLYTQLQSTPHKKYMTYFNRNKSGEPLKSCTISIKGENNKVIGLLCINFYLNTPLTSVIKNLSPDITKNGDTISENFTDNIDDLINESLDEVKTSVYGDRTISASNKNKEIISQLNNRGIFQLKDSVTKIADKLDISKNTVYMHIRNLNQK